MNRLMPIAAAAAALCVPAAHAAGSNFSNFTPMTSSVGAGTLPEAAPFKFGNSAWTQLSIADRTTQLAAGQFNSGNWDMIDTNRTGPDAGRYLFTVFETGQAGVQRTDLKTGVTITQWASPATAPNLNSHVAFDASRWTPWGTYLTAEESWGNQPQPYGRLFELKNPITAPASGTNFMHQNVIARVSHEGLAFDSAKSLYFIDELNGGSIYKYVSANPNAATGDAYFDKGQTFVLKVGAGGQFEGNNGPAITGAASWVAITSATGTPTADTFSALSNLGGGSFAMDGRAAADLVGGTGYNRPEDLEIQDASGTQRLYFATTDSDTNANTGDGRSRVYFLDLGTNEVRLFADASTLDLHTGLAVGGGLRNADNLAIDAKGNIYIIEDRDGGVDNDIWFARDLNQDGDLLDAGEGIGRWASNGVAGSENTGLYFDKFDPNKAYVNIQHPASGVDRLVEISAVPEPQTYAMMLAGLMGIGFVARRRKG